VLNLQVFFLLLLTSTKADGKIFTMVVNLLPSHLMDDLVVKMMRGLMYGKNIRTNFRASK